MKIVKLYINAFGKIKDFSLELSNGLNVIRQDNGFGKTTLANFVKAMLYGLNYNYVKMGEQRVNDVTRFAPWDGTKIFGGYVIVQHEGRTYRVERFFGQTARSERLSFTDEMTGQAVDFGDSVGEYLTGLTVDSYIRSAYYPQESVEISSNQNFDNKLANLVENGAEDYDKVQAKLLEYKRTFVAGRGDGGEIAQLTKRQMQLQRDYNQVQSNILRAQQVKGRLLQIEKEKAVLEQRRKDLLADTERLQQSLAQTKPTEAQLQTQAQLDDLRRNIARIPQEFDQDKQRCDEISQQTDSLPSQPTKAKPKRYLLVLAVLLFGVGMCLLAINNTGVGIAVAVIGIAIAVCSFVFAKADNTQYEQRCKLEKEFLTLASKYVNVANSDFSTAKFALYQAYNQYQGDVRLCNMLQSTLQSNVGNADVIRRQIDDKNAELFAVNDKMSALSQEQGSKTVELSSLDVDAVSIADKLNEVANSLAVAQYKFQVAEQTIELLAQAKTNLSSSYLPKLCQTASQLMQFVTRQSYQVVVDKNFAISLRCDGQTRSMDEYSRGIREITLLCFRIALSKLLYDGTVPFVIVDDAFVNYDDNNFANAVKLLNDISQHGQVVYFTCSKR